MVSLDLELHWGVRDREAAEGPYRRHLLGARQAVHALLDTFRTYDIAATWATVGFLLARDRDELRQYWPRLRPRYADTTLDPYAEELGEDEASDPLHFGASLVDAIRQVPGQELGTHTFSHYYCLEPGQTAATFRADLEAAVAIGESWGARPRSIVFPRNQRNPSYDGILSELGVTVYRGNQRGWMHAPRAEGSTTMAVRGARLLDAYLGLNGPLTAPWPAVRESDGLANVPATAFLRPVSRAMRPLEGLRRRRIAGAIRTAAREGRLVHLWWHPHNFGVDLEGNLAFLRSLLDVHAECRARYGMRSMGMAEAAGVGLPT